MSTHFPGEPQALPEDVDLSGLLAGVIGDSFGDVERGIFPALATACPPWRDDSVSPQRRTCCKCGVCHLGLTGVFRRRSAGWFEDGVGIAPVQILSARFTSAVE